MNRIFSPSEAEIAYAKDVFAAIAEAKRKGKGAIALRGKMIDALTVASRFNWLFLIARKKPSLATEIFRQRL